MQEDLKSLQLTVSEVGDQPEEAAAGSLTVEGVHGSRKWDVHVVAASKAEAAQVYGVFPEEDANRLLIPKPFDRQVCSGPCVRIWPMQCRCGRETCVSCQ